MPQSLWARAPTVTDDDTQGFYRSFMWVDTTNGNHFVCIDATTGAAVWSLDASATAFSLDGHTHAASDVVSGTFADARVSQSSVTQHQAALSITESQISDLTHSVGADGTISTHSDVDTTGAALGSITYFDGAKWVQLAPGTAGEQLTTQGAAAPTWEAADAGAGDLVGLTDTNITGVTDDEVLAWDSTSSKWINQTAGEAGLASSTHTHDASDVTSGTFADARVSQSSVTQHVAAIDHDSLLNYVADEHVAHSGVTLTAGTGLSGGGDITANRTFDVDINGLTADASPDGALDYVMTYDASAATLKKVTLNDLPTGAGESNTLSGDPAGTGVELVATTSKVGVDLRVRDLKAASSKAVVALSGEDVTVDMDPAQVNLADLADVSGTPAPVEGDALTWDNINAHWEARAIKRMTDDLSDVSTVGGVPADGCVLSYNGAQSQYVCVNGTANPGYVLTSNATGNATFQAVPSGSGSGFISVPIMKHNLPHKDTVTATYTDAAYHCFPGTSAGYTPTKIKCVSWQESSGTGKVRVRDITNSLDICELTGIAGTSATCLDMGTISNLSTGTAVWMISHAGDGAQQNNLGALMIEH